MPDAGNPLRYTPPRRLKLVGIVAVCAAILVVAIGVLGRVFADQNVAAWTETQLKTG